jgi:hypothetical protein
MCYTHCIALPSVHIGQGTLDRVAREDFHDIHPVHIQGEVYIRGLVSNLHLLCSYGRCDAFNSSISVLSQTSLYTDTELLTWQNPL